MNISIKSFLAVVCSAAFGISAFAQQTGVPSNNIPQASTPVIPDTLVYPDLKNISSSVPVNYVRTQIPDVPLQSILANANDYIRQTTSYLDGLGRPLQEVAKKAHASGYDLIQPHAYDLAGKETYQYLPYAIPLQFSTGRISRPVNLYMHHFYDPSGPEQPYSKTETDNSPLNLLKKQLSPGRSWVGSNRGVAYGRRGNLAGEVRIWTIGSAANALPSSAASYNVGEIEVSKVTDEDGKFALEYKDKEGRIILKKSLAINNSQPESDHNGYACTYYIYDDLSRLRFVIPPEAVVQKTVVGNTWSISQVVSDGLCFSYSYDERGQILEKKVPGKKVEYFVYDKRGRLCFSQDGNLRVQKKWKFTVYDALDRQMCTGLYQNTTANRTSLQNYFYDNNTYAAPSLIYYLKNYKNYKEYPLSTTTGAIFLTFNYYDDYGSYGPLGGYAYDGSQFANMTLPSNGTIVASELSNHTRGLLTGTKTRVLDADSLNVDKWLVSVNFYDTKGRLIQNQSQNIRGGLDISSNIYYFQGMLWRNIFRHENQYAKPVPGVTDGSLPQIFVVKTFERNLAMGGGNDQVNKVTQKIGNGITYDLALYQYDHLGRTTYKGFTAGEVLQEYNMRGFLNHINVKNGNNVTDSVHIFQEKLYYDTGFVSKLYNGNIAGITWKKSGTQAPVEAYGYSYDLLNRLTHAEYRRQAYNTTSWLKNTYDYTASGITYDMNGNIGSMSQKNPNALSGMNMDALSYQYAPNSNKLVKVTDNIVAGNTVGLPDFKDNANDAEEYYYDSCGNVIIDDNKSISSITYNYLNKPEKITVINQGIITYVYDALGNKLQKRVHSTAANPPADQLYEYFGNFVYKDSILQYILNDEGRARPIPIEMASPNNGEFTTKFVYDYFVKDHLGNVRSTVTAKPMDGIYLARHEVSSANIEQLVFDNIPNVRANKPGSTRIDDGMAARLDGSDPKTRIGTAIMLQTMPGDKFTISADAFYEGQYTQTDEVGPEDVITSLMSALTGGTTYAGIPLSELPDNVRTITNVLSNPQLASQLDNLVSTTNNPNAPKAHLNVLFFDDKMQLLPGNSWTVQVPENPTGWTNISPVGGGVTGVAQVWGNGSGPGWAIIYIDNQSIGKQVWFDNVMVGHYKGEVVEESHYYPFGLTLQTAQDPNVTKNPLKLTTKELESNFGLNTYDFGARAFGMDDSRWYSPDPHAENYYSISPYAYCGNNPVSILDGDGRDLVFFNSAGGEINRVASNTQFKTFVQTGSVPLPYFSSLPIFSEAPMPNVIQSKGGAPTTDPIYQRYDYNIAAETFIFNNNKNNGVTPTHTNGKKIDDPGSVPDLDPTLVKATIMQESVMGTFDPKPNDLNDSKSDIMQANVYFSSKSNDWGPHKTQFGLTKGGGATPLQSIKAGIGLMYQKGLKTTNGKTIWVGGNTWEEASKNYNGGGADNYGNVIKMKDASIKPSPSNYK